MDQVLTSMTLELFAAGNHKITPGRVLETKNALFLKKEIEAK